MVGFSTRLFSILLIVVLGIPDLFDNCLKDISSHCLHIIFNHICYTSLMPISFGLRFSATSNSFAKKYSDSLSLHCDNTAYLNFIYPSKLNSINALSISKISFMLTASTCSIGIAFLSIQLKFEPVILLRKGSRSAIMQTYPFSISVDGLHPPPAMSCRSARGFYYTIACT